MNHKRLLLLSLLMLSAQQLICMEHNKSKFIVECVPGKIMMRGYGEQYRPITKFALKGIFAQNSNRIDPKTLFLLPEFIENFESTRTKNNSQTFFTQHENKKYATKITPFMSDQDFVLLLIKIKLVQ